MTIEREKLQFDVIVVGAGGAGIAAAQRASERGAKVLIVSKDPITCSDSKISEGIVTVRGSGSSRDSVESLASNIRIGGDDIGDPALANRFAEDSASAYQWLLKQRTMPPLNKHQKPEALPTPLGGHNLPRSVQHKNGGLDFAHGLWNACMASPGIEYIEDAWFLDVISCEGATCESPACEDATRADLTGKQSVSERHVVGGLIYHASKGRFVEVLAPCIILASGGLGTLYFPHTDTMRGNTGDGYAAAARAGVSLIDMEQVQFLPFGITNPPHLEGILCGEPASAGPLGVLRDCDGKLVMGELMVRTRAEVSAAIMQTVAAGKGTENGGCYLDLTANAEGEAGELFLKLMRLRIPGILKSVRKAYGRDAVNYKSYWEVRPSAHYVMGGVVVESDRCETSLPGLFAAGQVLGGLHGSNRLGSTSLAEGLIFGLRAGEMAAESSALARAKSVDGNLVESAVEEVYQKYQSLLGQQGGETAIGLLRELQKESWEKIGPSRTGKQIDAFLDFLLHLKKRVANVDISGDLNWNQALLDTIELENLIVVAESIAVSAKTRVESLGAHVRLDESNFSANQKVGGASIVATLNHQSWSLKKLKRAKSPLKRRATDKIKREASIQMFRQLRKAPPKLRDRILKKKYQAML